MRLTKSDFAKLESVKDLLDKELKTKTIYELSRMSEMSESKLANSFSHLYGRTIFQYHLQKRMSFAREKIISGARIKEVAALLGYADAKAFNRGFKRVYKKTPRDLQ